VLSMVYIINLEPDSNCNTQRKLQVREDKIVFLISLVRLTRLFSLADRLTASVKIYSKCLPSS